MNDLFAELKWRGIVEQTAGENVEKIINDKCCFYLGIDPTAASLHVGHLMVLNLVRLLKEYGHTPILLIGSGTGMIGDPSGRSLERNLLAESEIKLNVTALEKQISGLLSKFSGPKEFFKDNFEWLGKLTLVDYLRDVGKYFPISQMIARDTVASRLTREGGGITYTEFSYMILQAYDFLELNKKHNCILQIGGADQWGNIVSGIDLIRKLQGKSAYGLTMPLLTKSDGKKFGKSESGTVWLDSNLTSPYQFYQFFLRLTDAEAIKFLKVLSNLKKEEILAIEKSMQEKPELRSAQISLAEYATKLVHGAEQLAFCLKATNVLFGGEIANLPTDLLLDIFKDVPSKLIKKSLFNSGIDILDLLIMAEVCSSKSQARQLISGGGLYLNNVVFKEQKLINGENLIESKLLILRSGKKNYHLIKTED